jgi:glycerol-3-phosphate dehydrogenase
MAPKWAHGHLSGSQIRHDFPSLTNPNLTDGFYYYDAEVDDSRLVLRVLQEGMENGGLAMNYTGVSHLLMNTKGKVCGVHLVDHSPGKAGREMDVEAAVVIHATGPWSDLLRSELDGPPRIRKQRGSHLIFSQDRLPLDRAITFFHPRDKRAMFVFPWEGVTMIGTTDLDHPPELEQTHPEPFITKAEVQYIFEALEYLFPRAALTETDVISSFAGIRPIVSSGTANPSKESRAHCLWKEKGLVTITGGKLTTYRVMALETLKCVRDHLPGAPVFSNTLPMFLPLPAKPREIPDRIWLRLAGRYGNAAPVILESFPQSTQSSVPGNTALWSEIQWGARAEAVEHLDDLLLRRVRIGLTDRQGGADQLNRVKTLVQEDLGWDDTRWSAEVQRYINRWNGCYYLPE